MRTTVHLDDDVAAALDRQRKEANQGLSEAVNDLIRRGLRMSRQQREVTLRTASVGLRVNVANVAEALEVLEGPAAR
jgi:metal-responsive CopG/Arc/MetJ family transcriptional regulator